MLDLAPREVVPTSMNDKVIEITVEDFCTILRDADKAQASVDQERRSRVENDEQDEKESSTRAKS